MTRSVSAKKSRKHETPAGDFFGLYLLLIRFPIWVASFFLPRDRMQAIEKIRAAARSRPKPKNTYRIWFHGASVGELESLWALVERFAENENIEVILTVFSESAFDHVQKCMKRLRLGQVTYAGYSPFEGHWSEGIALLQPDLFVTAKYEAWPDLWYSLAAAGIRLCIVGAKARSSLLLAKRILRLTRSTLPALTLVSFHQNNEARLKRHFETSEILHFSDPRWDRVRARSKLGHPRVSEIEVELSALPKPWLIAGSAWESDWITWRGKFEAERFEGTLFVVPHKVDAGSVKAQEILLRDLGWTPIRSTDRTGIRPAGKIAVIVDEMGFLAELYRVADLAYVGGGFGSSVHSTIEPAVHGVPIFAGPEGAEKFDEIEVLRELGQLTLLQANEDWSRFRVASQRILSDGARAAARAGVERFFGSSVALCERLKATLGTKLRLEPGPEKMG